MKNWMDEWINGGKDGCIFQSINSDVLLGT